MAAAAHGKLECLKYFAEKEVSLQMISKDGQSFPALRLAWSHENWKCVEFLNTWISKSLLHQSLESKVTF